MIKVANQIDHVVLLIDESGSMQGRERDVVSVVDGQVKWLAKRSQELDREVRVTVCKFNGTMTCLIFDKDVLRMPSIKDMYRPSGSTALIRSTMRAIDELATTSQLYGDHAFLMWVFSDGEETDNRHEGPALASKISGLPGNWSLGGLVPSLNAKLAMESYGFPRGNVAVWDINAATGVAEAGVEIQKATDTYFTGRQSGMRTNTSLFVQAPTRQAVAAAGLTALSPDQFFIFPAVATGNMAIHIPNKTKLKSRPEGIKHVEIKEMVESTGRPYMMGNAFYELVKSEKITGEKDVAVIEVATNKVYTGKQARALIGLDEFSRRVRPMPKTATGKPEFDIFIQSTSTNRLLPVGSRVLLLK